MKPRWSEDPPVHVAVCRSESDDLIGARQLGAAAAGSGIGAQVILACPGCHSAQLRVIFEAPDRLLIGCDVCDALVSALRLAP